MNVEVREEIKKHVEKMLAYTDDERKKYERCLEDGPVKEHIWVDIQEIGKWIGL